MPARKAYSGKFNLRVSTELHESISVRAAAENKSINQCVSWPGLNPTRSASTASNSRTSARSLDWFPGGR
ncbi:MAG: toxin-antitoxin system HicB family antitoxin [Haliea sp.]|nr:toxin-antitoxin system HicB family antitoxin [Haliea sp.]